ncbi:unnamed protein product [Vitrella brassicaformis CCMP3155]|uniref:Uncharacterized protein n=1 Tax=Vitrella brassicaformis (strain CCMP3155) TaxID=1169540 RepID=A0A0G4E8E1_VITBC|nr:unnamed protein product [Vitrella brassicaformis CCMP3155]|eukprot:CEL91987.1 unnamed protein product [Vitrella brassicaformis CCMP3155]
MLINRSVKTNRGFVFAQVFLRENPADEAAAGLVFRVTGNATYLFAELHHSRKGHKSSIDVGRVKEGSTTKLASVEYPVKTSRFYNLAVDFGTKHIRVFVDGAMQVAADVTGHPETERAYCGMFAKAPAFFLSLRRRPAQREGQRGATRGIPCGRTQAQAPQAAAAEEEDDETVPVPPFAATDYTFQETPRPTGETPQPLNHKWRLDRRDSPDATTRYTVQLNTSEPSSVVLTHERAGYPSSTVATQQVSVVPSVVYELTVKDTTTDIQVYVGGQAEPAIDYKAAPQTQAGGVGLVISKGAALLSQFAAASQ